MNLATRLGFAGLLLASSFAGCSSDNNRSRTSREAPGVYATPDDPTFRDDGTEKPGISPGTQPGGVREPDSGSGPGSPGYGDPSPRGPIR